MADTKREKIIANSLIQLAKILTANGYNFTMSTPKRAQKSIDTRDYPVSVLFPGVEENERKYAKHNLSFQIRIESHILIGGANASVLQEKMLGDLIRNISNPAEVWSTFTEDVSYIEGGPADQPEAEDKATAVYAIFQIKYKTDIGNPY